MEDYLPLSLHIPSAEHLDDLNANSDTVTLDDKTEDLQQNTSSKGSLFPIMPKIGNYQSYSRYNESVSGKNYTGGSRRLLRRSTERGTLYQNDVDDSIDTESWKRSKMMSRRRNDGWGVQRRCRYPVPLKEYNVLQCLVSKAGCRYQRMKSGVSHNLLEGKSLTSDQQQLTWADKNMHATPKKNGHGRLRGCGVCGSAFLSLKRFIIPRGAFGKGKRARTAEGLAFLVYIIVVSVSINWVVVAAFLYFNTGWLSNLSTTFATYQSLEAPSVVLCSHAETSEPQTLDILARVILLRNGKDYLAKVFAHKCPNIGEGCYCVNSWSLPFFDRFNYPMPGPVILRDDTLPHQVAPDTLEISFYRASHLGLNFPERGGDSHNKHFNKHRTQHRLHFRTALQAEKKLQNGFNYSSPLTTHYKDSYSSNIQTSYNPEPFSIGIYDSKLIPELGDTPTWIGIKEYCDLTVALSLVRSWVIDPYRISWKRIIQGELAHGEHTFLVDLHRISTLLTTHNQFNTIDTKEIDHMTEQLGLPIIRINIMFASYTVLEVWRVGVSFSVALMGLAAICLSAFNKIFIFNTLFPYYDKAFPQPLQLSPIAKTLVCGYFGSNHPDTTL